MVSLYRFLPAILLLIFLGAAWMYRFEVTYAGGNDFLRLDRWSGAVEACSWQDGVSQCRLLGPLKGQ